MNVGLFSILMIIVFFIVGVIVGKVLAISDMKHRESYDGTITIYEDDKYYERIYSYESIKNKKSIHLRVIKK